MSQKHFSNGNILTVNLELAYEVYKCHPRMKKENLHNIDLIDHELVGKKLVRYSDGNEYNVESVHKQWYAGWYIAILLERNKSHHLVFWENINCIEETILQSIEEAGVEWQHP